LWEKLHNRFGDFMPRVRAEVSKGRAYFCEAENHHINALGYGQPNNRPAQLGDPGGSRRLLRFKCLQYNRFRLELRN
jgi:hypothetical protein